jgi:hypothetical protein
MANFLKFKVTEKIGDGYFGVGGLGAYRAGDVFFCTGEQAQRWIKLEDISAGFIEPMGEDTGDAWSENIRKFIDSRPGFHDNTLPVSVFSLSATATPDTQGTDLAGGMTISRRVAVDKFLVNHTTASGGAVAPVIFASAGHPVTDDATNVVLYDASSAAYFVAASNTVTAAIGGNAWAVGDMILIGYPEKFASAMWAMTAASTGTAAVEAILHWNGSEWVEFADFIDLTQELLAGPTLARAGVDTNTRMVWSYKSVDWKKGGPAGSPCDPNSYYVAVKLTAGGLASLAGAIPRPVLDTPLAWFSLGTATNAPEAVALDIAGTVSDKSSGAVVLPMTNTSYLYIGAPQVFSTLNVDMSANVNSITATLSAAYWNGRTWATVAITDGTANSGATFGKDGAIVLSSLPFDWIAAPAGPELGLVPPATLSGKKLYWIRLKVSATLTTTTEVTALTIAPPTNTWVEFNAYPNSFVEAGEPIKLFVNDEDSTADGVEVKVVAMDV